MTMSPRDPCKRFPQRLDVRQLDPRSLAAKGWHERFFLIFAPVNVRQVSRVEACCKMTEATTGEGANLVDRTPVVLEERTRKRQEILRGMKPEHAPQAVLEQPDEGQIRGVFKRESSEESVQPLGRPGLPEVFFDGLPLTWIDVEKGSRVVTATAAARLTEASGNL
jgi:hypothetical protein